MTSCQIIRQTLIAQISNRRRAGASLAQIAADLQLDYDGYCILLPGWYASDGECAVYYDDATSSRGAAERYASGDAWLVADERARSVAVQVWRVAVCEVGGRIVECDTMPRSYVVPV